MCAIVVNHSFLQAAWCVSFPLSSSRVSLFFKMGIVCLVSLSWLGWSLTVLILSGYIVHIRHHLSLPHPCTILHASTQGLQLERQGESYPLVLEQVVVAPIWIFLVVRLPEQEKQTILVWRWQLSASTRKKFLVLLETIREHHALVPVKEREGTMFRRI